MDLRVAVLDSEESLRKLISLIMQHKGYEVFASSEPLYCPLYTGKEQSCDRDEPCTDVMILDRQLPKMSALSYLSRQMAGGCRIKNRHKLVLSIKATDREIQETGRLGCALLKKPFRVEDISGWVDECAASVNPARVLRAIKVVEGK
jgi:DNA-binding response OmpR family regulator